MKYLSSSRLQFCYFVSNLILVIHAALRFTNEPERQLDPVPTASPVKDIFQYFLDDMVSSAKKLCNLAILQANFY